jgi:FO synthase
MQPQPQPKNPLVSALSTLALAANGELPNRDTALYLALNTPLPDLLSAATTLRAQQKSTTITYSKKVFIPLTTLCRDYCTYCTFRKDPGQPGAHFMTPDEVLALAEQGRRAGCKETLFSLGDQPERIFPSTTWPPCANSYWTAPASSPTPIPV